MFKFSLDGIKRMGEADPKYGQAYWCTSTDVDLPIKFNSMDKDLDHRLEDGPLHIVAEEKSERQSAKGTDYIQLKKVRVAEKVSEDPFEGKTGTDEPSVAQDTLKQSVDTTITLAQAVKASLDRIESKLDRLLGNDEEPAPPEEKARDWDKLGKKEDVVITDIGDEPINLDDIPFN